MIIWVEIHKMEFSESLQKFGILVEVTLTIGLLCFTVVHTPNVVIRSKYCFPPYGYRADNLYIQRDHTEKPVAL